VKVKVTKQEGDGRTVLCGEPLQIGEDGKEFFIIPAFQGKYIRETTGYDVSDEFLPEEEPTPAKK
jgi:hypothetical protein